MNFNHENLPEHEVTKLDLIWGTCRLPSNTQYKLDGTFQFSKFLSPPKKVHMVEVVSSKTSVIINKQLSV